MLGFLANLGSGLAKIGSGFAHGASSIGHGAANVGKGIGRGFKRLGQLGAGEDDLGPGGTPGFNPNAGYPGLTPGINPDAGRGVRMVEDAVATAENDARADSLLERRFLPIAPPTMPGGPPPLSPAPSLTNLRSALPSPLPSGPTPPMVARSAPPVSALPDLVPDMDLDRRNVPIPRLPGQKGAPIPYNPIDAAKYESVMSHAKRDAEGDLIPKSEGGGFNRDWGMTLKNALLGGAAAARSARPGEDPLGAAIGGALTGGVGSAINPQAGYEFAFDVGERPKLEAETNRARAEQDRQRIERAAAMDETLKQAQVNRIPLDEEAERAKIAGTRAATEISRRTANRQDALTQSQIKLNDARAEAAQTGKAVMQDIVGDDGQIRTYQVFPNGAMVEKGGSAKAAMNEQNIKSREKIATSHDRSAESRVGMQQGGANTRNAATIAGAEKRTQMKIDAQPQGGQGQSKLRKSSSGGQGGKTADMDQLRKFYKSKGVTDDAEIRRRAAKFGITVKD
jgi:hypothetical protein